MYRYGSTDSNLYVCNSCYENDIEPDGRILTEPRDPPGQRSFYILPGNTRTECYRLSTFFHFPANTPVNPRDLAKAGFLYTGYKDRVKCFECSLCIDSWLEGDWVQGNDATTKRWHRETCSMMLGENTENVPFANSLFMSADRSRPQTARPWTQQPTSRPLPLPPTPIANPGFTAPATASSTSQRQPQPNETRNLPIPDSERPTAPPRHNIIQSPQRPNEEQRRNLATLFPCLYPANAHMRGEGRRLETFDRRWTGRVAATTQQIAEAGFFYIGDRDRVKCWYCNGGLQNWEPQDEPWKEHAKWFPTCDFLLSQMGTDFVHNIVAQFPHLPRQRINNPHAGILNNRRRTPSPTIIDPAEEMQKIEGAKTKLKVTLSGSRFKNVFPNNTAKDTAIECMYDRCSDTESFLRVADISESELFVKIFNFEGGDAVCSVYGNDQKCNTHSNEANPELPEEAPLTTGEPVPGSSAPRENSSPSQMCPEVTGSAMQSRIRELEDERKCKICLDKPADIVFTPCGHLCACESCTGALRKCPICRMKIEKAIKTYVS
ncbi:RING-HC finger protein [uncultured Endozoicomonas sp.]|uniref:RING-HC finger protein n=1 Tax=uncultured Endozoicomonas sp. TaxID=432652 RepID=UPI0034461E7F